MKNKGNLIFENVSGSIRLSRNCRLVVKKYKTGTVLAVYPRKKKIKTAGNQKDTQKIFKKAVAYAQKILRDPERRKAFGQKLAPGTSVYHAAIKEYNLIHNQKRLLRP